MKIVTVCCKCKATEDLFEYPHDPAPDQVDHDLCEECRIEVFGDDQ